MQLLGAHCICATFPNCNTLISEGKREKNCVTYHRTPMLLRLSPCPLLLPALDRFRLAISISSIEVWMVEHFPLPNRK